MNVVRRGGVAFAVLLLNAAVGHAHTLASTIVSVTMTRPGTVTITMAAEADPLIAKLEALAGIAASDPPATREGRRARIESLFSTLRAHIDARVAGRPLVLELQDVTVDDTAQTELRLTAKRPSAPEGGPHQDRGAFTWRCTFIFGAYQFASGDDVEDVQWLQGAQASAPIALQPSRAWDDSSGRHAIRIGPSLVMGALVVYVIRRRAAGRRVRLYGIL
jgi:hypothetical protein